MFTYTETESNLLKAIAAAPADDVPRCVLADALLEGAERPTCRVCEGAKGWFADKTHTEFVTCGHCGGLGWVSDGRAEFAAFIQCQLELSRRPGCEVCRNFDQACPCGGPTGTTCRELWGRADRLLEKYGPDWFPCGRVAYRLVTRAYWERERLLVVRRGFPEEVCGVSAQVWVGRPGGPVTSRNPCYEIALPEAGLGRDTLADHPTVTQVTPLERPHRWPFNGDGAAFWHWPASPVMNFDIYRPKWQFASEGEAYAAMSDHLIRCAKGG